MQRTILQDAVPVPNEPIKVYDFLTGTWVVGTDYALPEFTVNLLNFCPHTPIKISFPSTHFPVNDVKLSPICPMN